MLKTAVLSIALVAGGCFTSAGAITGGAVASSKIKRGENASYGEGVVTGALLGLVVDAVLIVAVASSIHNDLESASSTWNWDWSCDASCND